jgi:enediyne biosynthesis protein E4
MVNQPLINRVGPIDFPRSSFGLVTVGLLSAAWVLTLLVGCGSQSPEPPPAVQQTAAAVAAGPFFEEITASTGVNFQHWCGDGGQYFFPEIMGSGIALLDYDRDDDLDIFVVQGMPPVAVPNRTPPDSPPSPTSRLYQQVSSGHFEDVTDAEGLNDPDPYGMGVAVGDVNNDGWLDIYVSKFGKDRLWLNREGKFQDVTAAAGIENPRWGASCCFVDYDRDGWLDLYVVNYVDYFPSQHCVEPSGSEDYCHPARFQDSPARLFRNVTGEDQSDAKFKEPRFKDASFETGINGKVGPGLGVLAADFTGDGWIDLYAANDAKGNFLWVNQAGKKFQDEAIGAGAAYDAAGKPQSSMGVTSGDVDGDGRRDLFMTHLDGEYSTLYLQVSPGNFEDQTAAAGLATPTIPTTGFGTALLDIDLDGDLDLVIGNGRVRRRDGAVPGKGAEFWKSYTERNQVFLNDGTGVFADVAAGKDGFLAEGRVTRGLAVGDLDNDGDLDVVTSEVNGPARIFMNTGKRRGSWLSVRAIDPRHGERDAYGAVITVTAGDKRWQRDINPGSSYLSSGDPRAHFGIGSADKVVKIAVQWPDGMQENFPGSAANARLILRRGEGETP